MAVDAGSLRFRGVRLKDGPPSELKSPPPPPPTGDAAIPTPVRAEGLELLGTFERSGHRQAPFLVRRADGQMVQLTPVLFHLLTAIDGARDHSEIAAAVGQRIGKLVASEDVSFLIEQRLRPLGLLQGVDGSQPVARRANPLLALRFRAVVTNPRVTGAIARVFAPLFHTPVVIAFTLAFLAVNGWLLFGHGLAGATRHALYEPQLLLVVFALATLSAGFHELGHAAACRYSGGRPGVMGVGLYLVWPAFYTDVTDSYRLDRRGRLRVDTGGLYFNAIFAVVAYGLWRMTGAEALLIVIPLQGLQMLRQLVPLVRLDGYHILADLTGVPDLFAHIKPILTSMLPTRWGRGDARALKPWVRAVVTAWVVLVVPVLLGTFALIIFTLPRVVATAWDSAGQSWGDLRTAVSDGEMAAAALAALSIAALAIPAASMVYLVVRVARRAGGRLWRSTKGYPARRALALITALALLVAIAGAWWPRGQYTPIQRYESGTIGALDDAPTITTAASGLEGAELTSMVLPVVTDDGAVAAPTTYRLVELGPDGQVVASTAFVSADERARFPFPLPDPPGVGDNQALVVNTVDGSHMIDLALSLVFVDGDTVDNRNEAYALANCTSCTTVAIAFQVVIIIDGSHIVIPENVAAAINAECARCITHALATQLIGTTVSPLTEAQMAELQALWTELEALDAAASTMSLDAVYAQLDEIQTEIESLLVDSGLIHDTSDGVATQDAVAAAATGDQQADILESDPTGAEETSVGAPAPSSSPSPSTSPTPSSSPSSEPSPTPSNSP